MQIKTIYNPTASYLALYVGFSRCNFHHIKGRQIAEDLDSWLSLSHPNWIRAMKLLEKTPMSRIKFSAFWLDKNGKIRIENKMENVLLCAMDSVAQRFPQGWGYTRPQELLRAVRGLLISHYGECWKFAEGDYRDRRHNRPRITARIE